jgi:hypothetical protein
MHIWKGKVYFQNRTIYLAPLIQWVPGAFRRGTNRPGREAHHSPQCSAEVPYTSLWLSV